MTDNVVKFYPQNAAQNPDAVLDQAIGQYDKVFVIGYSKDGDLDVRGSLNFTIGDIFFALEAFKHMVLAGEYGDRLKEGRDD